MTPLDDVVICTTYFHPEEVGIAPYATAFAQRLDERGFSVRVMCPHPHYPEWRSQLKPARELQLFGNVQVQRHAIYVPSTQSAIRRAGYEFSFATQLAARERPRARLYISLVPNLLPALVAGSWARATSAPHWTMVQDITSAAAGQSGIAGGRRLSGLLERVEGRTLASASWVSAVSPGFLPVLERMGVARERMSVLRNWSRPVTPARTRQQVRCELGWGPELVVVHGGNMGNKQGLHELGPIFEAAERLGSIRFAFFGAGSESATLEALAAEYQCVELHPPRFGVDFADVLNAADVGLLKERASVSDMSLPSKLTAYFHAGLPVLAITNPHGISATEVRKSGGGLIASSDERDAALACLRSLGYDDGARELLGAAGRVYSERSLSAEAAFAAFDRQVDKLLTA